MKEGRLFQVTPRTGSLGCFQIDGFWAIYFTGKESSLYNRIVLFFSVACFGNPTLFLNFLFAFDYGPLRHLPRCAGILL